MSATSPIDTKDASGYQRAREDAAWFELPSRALLLVSGPQRQKFLHGLLSNDVQSRTPGQGCRAALLDAKGHLLAFLRVLVGDNDVVLELPADRREELQGLLEHYRVATPVRFAASSHVVLGLVGPKVLEHLRGRGVEVPALAAESHARVAIAGVEVRVARAGDLPLEGYVLHVAAEGRGAVAAWLAEAGLAPLSTAALDALRIEEGRPWYGPDVSPRNLLHETGLVRELHSPTKGCYVGQEVIARLEARGGNVSQRLQGLLLAEPRPVGTPLTLDGKDVGLLTTSAVSPRRGPIAMGYVHRSAADAGHTLDAAGARTEVTALPMPPDASAKRTVDKERGAI